MKQIQFMKKENNMEYKIGNKVKYNGNEYIAIDTAGMRKKGKI